MALFDATTQGTGKTLLSEVVSLVCSGRPARMFSATRDAEEWPKVLTSVLLERSAVVVIDNVNYRLDNGDFSKALTETTHGDRVLRKSQTINLPVRCAWIATGNNIQLGGDMPRPATGFAWTQGARSRFNAPASSTTTSRNMF